MGGVDLNGCVHTTLLLSFKLELAKQLIGGFSRRKKYAGKKRKVTNLKNAFSLPSLPGHREVKLEGRECESTARSMVAEIHQGILQRLYLDVMGGGSPCHHCLGYIIMT